MKKYFVYLRMSLLIALVSLSFLQSGFAQDNKGGSPLPGLLIAYYNLKDALVKGDAGVAATAAGEFLKTAEGVNKSTLPAADAKPFSALQEKLEFDARHISEVRKIEHQREHFASLSNNMYQLAKAVKLSSQPVYQDFCPMKKTYWLSSETAIRNPYFGSQMLTCGKITDTIQ